MDMSPYFGRIHGDNHQNGQIRKHSKVSRNKCRGKEKQGWNIIGPLRKINMGGASGSPRKSGKETRTQKP